MTSFLDELSWRGLLYQTTGQDELQQHLLTSPRVGYAGFDPTASSLTIGNLIAILMLRHFQRAGHKPIVLMGGGTGLIGDPSGKDAERSLQSRDEVRARVASQRRIFERFLDFDGAHGALIVDNADWLEKLSFIEVLRSVGKHFSVNAMIQKDSVRTRLENREQGISYTEFSYMLLQAYDFLHLHRTRGCSIQMAGSDQYGNIVAGIDLIRREAQGAGHEAFGVTAPLVTRAGGQKIGKTEKGAIWLTSDMTSPYAFYQFWINAGDADVASFLRWYSPLNRAEIEGVLAAHQAEPHKREAQRVLAREVTRMTHGDSELRAAEFASQALFSGDVGQLSESMLDEVFADVPHSEHDKGALSSDGMSLVDVLALTSLVQSKREARQFVENGAVLVNGQRSDAMRRLRSQDLLHGKAILLKRGKKNWHVTLWK